MQNTEYKLITGNNEYYEDFLTAVNDAIRKGWQLQGGISVSHYGTTRDGYTVDDVLFAQAITRTLPKE